MKIGFIGLGLMGKPMATNILKAGFSLTVYNRTSTKAEELQKLGAKVAKTPRELAQNSDVVITMVTAPQDVEQVIFGQNGVVESQKKGLIVVDMSTIGPTAAKAIGKKLEEKGVEFIDAPVTGSTPRAFSGELTIFIGGKEDIYKKIQPVLSAMGTTLHYIGPTGSGQAIKIVNNFLVAADTIALSEAVILADTMGLPRTKVAEALKTATGFSPSMNLVMPDYITNTYQAKFSLANLKKDVSLAAEEVKKTPFELTILKHAKKLYDEGVEKQLGNENFSAVFKIVESKKKLLK